LAEETSFFADFTAVEDEKPKKAEKVKLLKIPSAI